MYHFIINPHSRTGKGLAIWETVKNHLEEEHIPYTASLTEYVGHARKLAASLSSKEESSTIVVVGGDGTINEVLSGIDNSDSITMGYIPTGSGNDFAKGMGIPRDTEDALDTVLHGQIALLDLCSIQSGRHLNRFGVSAGMGFDAAICHEALSSPLKKVLNRLRLGKLTYLLLAIKQLIIFDPTTITITVDGTTRTYRDAYFAAVMNQPCEGGGVRLCPQAVPDDGYLDVCLVAGVSKLKFLLVLPLGVFGHHTNIEGVHFFRGKCIELHSEEPLAIHRDGESDGMQTDTSIQLENKTLKVLIPMLY